MSVIGMYTLSEQIQAQGASKWLAGILTEPNFEYVTLLLHGDGTNGAQNNTFIDSSTNNATITRYGNTTQGTFSPYGDLWSNYFDGTGDYLVTPSNTAFAFGTGNWTLECWVYLTAYTTGAQTSLFYSSTNNENFDIGGTTNSPGKLSYWNGSTGINSASGVVPLNSWTHVAFVRDGTTVTGYVNGTSVMSGTISAPNNTSAISYSIGGNSGGSILNGYISNARIVKGTAVYTANFTPPTVPLTVITNTSLLTCHSNRFYDASTNNFTITRNGDVKVTKFSPFNPSAAYATGTLGGSGYFDGTGDYLGLPASANFAFGTGDFTVEAWIYPTGSNGGRISNRQSSPAGSSSGTWGFNYSSSSFTFTEIVTGEPGVTASGLPPMLNAWTHLAACRSGTTLRLYANGIQVGSGTVSTNFSSSSFQLLIAATPEVQYTGYMSDVRIVKGTALYTSAFTPPTAPLSAVTNTQLLCKFTNAAIIDNSMMNNLETVGNAQISTTQKKFGTGALYFDGNGDYTTMRYGEAINFGTGNFTIEMWIYPTSTNHQSACLFTQEYIAGNSPLSISIYLSGATRDTAGNSIGFGVYNGPAGSTWIVDKPNLSAITINVWTHIALVRSGTTFTMYVNGSSVGTATNSTSCSLGTTNYLIGRRWDTTGSYPYYSGYIDDLRVIKGIARYTANFTPPTAPFEDL